MRRAAIRSVVATAAALLLWAAGVHAGSAAAEPVAVRYAALLHDAAGALQAADVATARNDVLAARMTPEFPRPPLRAPRAIAAVMSPSGPSTLAASSAAARSSCPAWRGEMR